MKLFVMFALISTLLNCISFCQEREAALKFFTKNYTKIGRPIANALLPLKININSFKLLAVEYIDEMTSTLSIQRWFQIVSFDLRFSI